MVREETDPALYLGNPGMFSFTREYTQDDARRDMGGYIYDGYPREIQGADGRIVYPSDTYNSYASHMLGAHHALQTARYPKLHRDITLPVELEIEPGSEHHLQAARAMLEALCEKTSVASNMHPLGHQAVAAGVVCELLANFGCPDAFWYGQDDASTFAYHISRHVLEVHEVGENTYPGLPRLGLQPIGDLTAGTKLPEDKQHEAEIVAVLLGDNGPLAKLHTSEFRHMMGRFITHNVSDLPEAFVAYHAITEIAHGLCSARDAERLVDRAGRLSGLVWWNGEYEKPLEVPNWAQVAMYGMARQICSHVNASVAAHLQTLDELGGAKLLQDEVKERMWQLKRVAPKAERSLFGPPLITPESPFYGLPDITPKDAARLYKKV